MKSHPHLIGHLAAFATYAIFGFNIIFCKGIAAANCMSPTALITFRTLGAAALFWLISIFAPREKVNPKDLGMIVLAALMGITIPQYTFLTAVTCTTTIDTSILSSLTPIMTMFFAAIFLKEPITWKKAGGVAASFAGVILLIFNSAHTPGAVDHTQPLGVIMLLLNTLCFAFYLGKFRPLIARYSPLTFMKWTFLVAFVVSIPFSFSEILHDIDYASIPRDVLLKILYLILFATFIAYFLLPVAQKRIRPTLISLYSYLQPIIATIVSVIIGTDILTWQKLIAIALVFSGVAIVNNSRAAATPQQPKK